jgi:dCMP deaminase
MCRSVHAEQNAVINAARAGVSLLGGDIFIYGESRETNQPINAFPCFICKKMIINCGLKRVICSIIEKEKNYIIFFVEDWIKEWQEKDIIEDKYQYGK